MTRSPSAEGRTASLDALPALLAPLRGLAGALRNLPPIASTGAGDPRSDALLLLELKAIPGLETELELPLFVGVQGGTNVGKSTVFNALAGKIISPSLVVAAATKHPLVFAHERWRSALLERTPFPRLKCLELSDPKELIIDAEATDRLYFRFHDDPRLESLAWIDSPDFDSSLATNAVGADAVAVLSDVTIFVTTAQKYRDRVLVEQLRRLLRLKDSVVVAFNLLEEPIVHETLVDDLQQALGADGASLHAVRIPPARARHPEEEVRAALGEEILSRFTASSPRTIQLSVIRKTAERALELADQAAELYSSEAKFKTELQKMADGGASEAQDDYATTFQLALPEETLAIRRALRVTEIAPWIQLRPGVASSSAALSLAGGAIRRVTDSLRRLLVRWARSDEGTIDTEGSSLGDYAEARDRADAESVLRVIEPLRVRLESHARARDSSSQTARQLLEGHFTPEHALGFAARVREVHRAALEEGKDPGTRVLADVEAWIARHPAKAKAARAIAVAWKILCGLGLAWALPPAEGLASLISPLKWLYFAAGYVAGAYLIALLLSFRLRRRRRFFAFRRAAMGKTLERSLVEPLRGALDGILSDPNLRLLDQHAKEARARLAGGRAEAHVETQTASR